MVIADISPGPTSQPAPPTVTIPVVVELVNGGQTVQMTLNAEQAAKIAALVKDPAKAI